MNERSTNPDSRTIPATGELLCSTQCRSAWHGAGVVLEAPTWRANLRWAAQLGYAADTPAVSKACCLGRSASG